MLGRRALGKQSVLCIRKYRNSNRKCITRTRLKRSIVYCPLYFAVYIKMCNPFDSYEIFIHLLSSIAIQLESFKRKHICLHVLHGGIYYFLLSIDILANCLLLAGNNLYIKCLFNACASLSLSRGLQHAPRREHLCHRMIYIINNTGIADGVSCLQWCLMEWLIHAQHIDIYAVPYLPPSHAYMKLYPTIQFSSWNSFNFSPFGIVSDANLHVYVQ